MSAIRFFQQQLYNDDIECYSEICIPWIVVLARSSPAIFVVVQRYVPAEEVLKFSITKIKLNGLSITLNPGGLPLVI